MTEPLRTLIVDDEPIARRGIIRELTTDPEISVIGQCSNAVEAITSIKKEKPDLVFLDIQMPKKDGFAVVEAIGLERMPAVVFVTAYDEYALKAFDAEAIDYVLKPIDPKRFQRTLRRAKAGVLQRRHSSAISSSGTTDPRSYLSRLIVRYPGRVQFVNVNEIDWMEAADNYVCLHIGRQSLLHRETIKNLDRRLDPHAFVRIRRSTIINTNRIKQLRRNPSGEFCVVLENGHELFTSRRFQKRIRHLLNHQR